MASPFIAQPAGTPVAPSTSARYYYRRQVYSRNPVTQGNFVSGRNVNFNFEASGGHYFVPQESRIVAKLKIKATDGTSPPTLSKLERSVRFACDPVSNMWSAAQLSINGTTVESHANNVDDIARIQLRTEHTKAGADGPGSAGLLSFNQKMLRQNHFVDGTDNSGGASGDERAAAAAIGFTSDDERSDKYELLVQNCSNVTHANADETEAVEISSPLGQVFTFCRQTKAFLPNMQFQIQLTISDNYEKDMFYTQELDGVVSNVAYQTAAGGNPAVAAGRVSTLISNKIAPAARAPNVEVEELYLDAMFAVPSVSVPPPTSLQVPYQAVTVYTRTLTASSNFTETFTSIPASVGAIVIGLRDATHAIAINRELYERGAAGTAGDTQGIKTLSLALGSLQLPIPAYQLNFSKHQFGRLFADWLSFTGGSASNGVGGDSMTEFAKSPLAAFRVLQEPGAYASTAIVRMETNGANVDANTEMVLWCIHQKVFEAFWSDGETFPSKVVVDDVLN
eukprot:COSAG05_NODE_248_length_12946_cov_85.003737_6_plen_509_part_00